MFENIIAQDRVIAELSKAVNERALPGAVLFSGDHYTGKMSAALELARVLTCGGDGSWNCVCRACESGRQLLHPYIQIVGSGFFMEEISACADGLKSEQPLWARYMFIRAVRKLLKRFDPVLWEGNEPKYKQVAAGAVKAEELLRDIPLAGDVADQKKFVKSIEKICTECQKISDSFNTDNIPIDQIRRIHGWARTSSDSVKVVIFENADMMGESSRNSILKILEEPPSNCYFILTTSRKGAIIPTILSRVRVFNFKSRTEDEAAMVVSRIFRDQSGGYRSVREYFLARKADTGPLRQLAADFSEILIAGGQYPDLASIGKFKDVYSQKRLFLLFIEESLNQIRRAMLDGRVDRLRADRLNGIFREALMRREQYNQSSQLVLEALYYNAMTA